MAKESSLANMPKRWDSSSRMSFEKDNVATVDALVADRATSSSVIPQDEETKALKKRIAYLEQENERLKASVYLLTEKLSRRRDSHISMDALLGSTSSSGFPPASLTPSPTIVPQNVNLGATRRFSNDVSAIHSRQGKEFLILEDDMDDASQSSDPYVHRFTLSGHDAAVYQCRFSPDGMTLSSTSLDCSIRVWSTSSGTNTIVGMHSQGGSDVAWMGPSLVASSSLDMSVKLWDVGKANPETPLASLNTNGIALCLDTLPGTTSLVTGTSVGCIQVFDTRVSSSASDAGIVFHGEGAVNAVCCGIPNIVLSGDAKGYLRGFDVRMTGHQDLFTVQDSRPISGIAWSPDSLLAVNSYDNALRIFARDAAGDTIKMIHTLRGHKSKNLPIRSSFSKETPHSKAAIAVATGSANKACYIFSPLHIPSSTGSGEESPALSTQVLQGHTGNVYSCDFSIDNHLATCSADGTICLWSRRS